MLLHDYHRVNQEYRQTKGLKIGSIVYILPDLDYTKFNQDNSIPGVFPKDMWCTQGCIVKIHDIGNLSTSNPISLRPILGYSYTLEQETILRERVFPFYCMVKASITKQ